MTRSTAREIAIHCAFSIGFSHQTTEELLQSCLNPETFLRWKEEDPLYREYPNEKQVQYITQLVKGVGDHGPELDEYIARYAKNWQFARISRTAAAIMRVAMYEILYMPQIPNAAAINEAVEIAKGYEEPKVVAFINGILGAFVRAELPEESRAGEPSAAPTAEPTEPAETDPEPMEPMETAEADPEPMEPMETAEADPEPMEPAEADPEPMEPTETDPEPMETAEIDPEPMEPMETEAAEPRTQTPPAPAGEGQ